MKAARAGLLALAVATAALLASSASAANLPSTTYLDKAGGYEVAIPKTWQLVPRSVAQVQTLIAQLKKKKETELAQTYATIIGSASGRSELKNFRFQAFDWPPTSSVETDMSIAITSVPKSYGNSKLKAIGATFANQLAANPGSKVTVPKPIKLASGMTAEFIEGSVPAPTKAEPATGFQLFLILRPQTHRLYELSFRIDARDLSQVTLFASIADHFKFV